MTRNDNTKTVFLDEYHSHPLVISPAALEQITTIVMQNRVCKVCARAYTKDNPQVVQNTCLCCFLKSDAVTREKHLTYVGEFGLDYNGRDMQYKFLDADGYVFIVDSGTEYRTLEKSVYQTLLDWKFTIPETIMRNGEEKQLDTRSWRIYGDFQHTSVVVLKYHESYGELLDAVFFASRDLAVEMNKRTRAVRELLKKARMQIEATKDVQGRYHFGEDWTTYTIEDHHLYPLVSTLLSAEYDQAKGGQNPCPTSS